MLLPAQMISNQSSIRDNSNLNANEPTNGGQ